jgi:hypothetical protein
MATHKCHYQIINNCKIKPEDLNISLYNQTVNRSQFCQFLGLCIDEKLNFNEHMRLVKKRCVSRLNVLKALSHKSWSLSSKTLTSIYISIIRSIFEYPSILAPTLSKENIRQLQVIQNSALRICLKLPRETITTRNQQIKNGRDQTSGTRR